MPTPGECQGRLMWHAPIGVTMLATACWGSIGPSCDGIETASCDLAKRVGLAWNQPWDVRTLLPLKTGDERSGRVLDRIKRRWPPSHSPPDLSDTPWASRLRYTHALALATRTDGAPAALTGGGAAPARPNTAQATSTTIVLPWRLWTSSEHAGHVHVRAPLPFHGA
jgi:hypothetical protein